MASFRFVKFLKTVLFNILIFILTLLLVFIVLPILIIFLTPLFIFRWILFKTSKHFRPDLAKMLSTGSVIFAAEDMYFTSGTTVVMGLKVQGTPDLERARNEMAKNVVYAKRPKTGELMYPELQQNVATWMGYLFWKPVKEFKMENHVYLKEFKDFCNDDSPFNYDKFSELVKNELIVRPWNKENALWEIILIPNYISEKGSLPVGHSGGSPTGHHMLLLRFHHCLADALSTLKMMIQAFGVNPYDEMKKFAKPSRVKESAFRRFFKALTFIMRVPYEFTHVLVSSKDRNEWKLSEKALRSEVVHGGTTDLIPVSYIKDIKNRHKVSFTSVILAMITAGMREMMLKLKGNVPKKIHLLIPLPLPGHPYKLRNYMSLGFLALPLGEKDPIKRLQKCHKNFEKLRRSTIPITMVYLQKIVGGFPLCLAKRFKKMTNVTAMLSNTPGVPRQLNAFGNLIDEAFVGGNLPGGTTALVFSFYAYNQNARFGMGTFDTILPTMNDAEEFLKHCEDQLQYLSSVAIV